MPNLVGFKRIPVDLGFLMMSHRKNGTLYLSPWATTEPAASIATYEHATTHVASMRTMIGGTSPATVKLAFTTTTLRYKNPVLLPLFSVVNQRKKGQTHSATRENDDGCCVDFLVIVLPQIEAHHESGALPDHSRFVKKEHRKETHTGTYSSLTDLILGFDRKILRTAFRVSDEVMEALAGGRRPPAIVPMEKKDEDERKDGLNWVNRMVESLAENGLLGLGGHHHKKDKKHKPFNIFKKKPDFSNFYGWSLAIDHKEFHALKDSNIGLFMVNLTKGSMMGPHWNPKATEIAIVTYGEGMVQIVAPNETDRCGVRRFKVSEGDVFATSRYEPMAQMSYDNDSLVFMGFSTKSKRNHPQFLAGSSSVLQTLGEGVVSLSLNANRSDVRQLLSSQADAIILACPYCAVEEEKLMKEEEERQRETKEEEEEERREREKEREEEEARKKREEEAEEKWEREEREEEEARKRREEEEEERKREEEERREREEEEGEREAREEEEEGRGWRKKLVFKGRREWN
ncbi:Vicilin-like seed storage protein [Nymphaea thermarum]|nr:Vicilin-like seed storage protein [Nymphaea thermarum]